MILYLVGHMGGGGPLRLENLQGERFVLARNILQARNIYRDWAYGRRVEIGRVVVFEVPSSVPRVLDRHEESTKAQVDSRAEEGKVCDG